MQTVEERLKELAIELPPAPSPVGAYVPAVRAGNLVFLSGMLPFRDGKITKPGLVGEGGAMGAKEAKAEARQACLNGLSVLSAELGGLHSVTRCVKLSGHVASAPGFTDQPIVINGASELLFEVFGEKGRHARAALGAVSLPLGSPVELELIFEFSEK